MVGLSRCGLVLNILVPVLQDLPANRGGDWSLRDLPGWGRPALVPAYNIQHLLRFPTCCLQPALLSHQGRAEEPWEGVSDPHSSPVILKVLMLRLWTPGLPFPLAEPDLKCKFSWEGQHFDSPLPLSGEVYQPDRQLEELVLEGLLEGSKRLGKVKFVCPECLGENQAWGGSTQSRVLRIPPREVRSSFRLLFLVQQRAYRSFLCPLWVLLEMNTFLERNSGCRSS